MQGVERAVGSQFLVVGQLVLGRPLAMPDLRHHLCRGVDHQPVTDGIEPHADAVQGFEFRFRVPDLAPPPRHPRDDETIPPSQVVKQGVGVGLRR